MVTTKALMTFKESGRMKNMNLKKNAKSWTIILTMMIASLAGCLGDGDTENEQKTINIAGSSTVFPVASAWGQSYLSLIHI